MPLSLYRLKMPASFLFWLLLRSSLEGDPDPADPGPVPEPEPVLRFRFRCAGLPTGDPEGLRLGEPVPEPEPERDFSARLSPLLPPLPLWYGLLMLRGRDGYRGCRKHFSCYSH